MTDITDEERRRRIDAAIREVEELRSNPHTPRHTYWLSFVDGDRPEGQRFLGVVLVDDCVNMADAIGQAHRARCNPGGEVSGYVIPKRVLGERRELDHAPRLTLMAKAELIMRELIKAD